MRAVLPHTAICEGALEHVAVQEVLSSTTVLERDAEGSRLVEIFTAVALRTESKNMTTKKPTESSQADIQRGLDRDGWQSRYEAEETGWDRGEPSPALMQWLENGQLKPCRILVPGCGRGHEVIELASRGFDVTALDFAKAPVDELTRQLSERSLTANVVQADVLEFTTEQKFDAVYEQTCLCAIAPQHRETYEQRLAENLRDGGQLFALFMQSDKPNGPPFHCDISAMHELFDSSRWIWPDEQSVVEHPAGLQEIAIVLQRGG